MVICGHIETESGPGRLCVFNFVVILCCCIYTPVVVFDPAAFYGDFEFDLAHMY